VALLLYAVVGLRAGWEAQRELRAGRAALGAQDSAAAVTHWGRALRWYLPGLPANRAAAASLWELAQGAEAAGDAGLALAAYREIRRGLHATRSLWTPQPKRLAAADERIAALMALQGEVDSRGQPAPLAARVAEHRALLARDPLPNAAASLMVVLGFFAWVGAAFAATWWGMDAAGHLRPRQLVLCAAPGALGFCVWILGLLWA